MMFDNFFIDSKDNYNYNVILLKKIRNFFNNITYNKTVEYISDFFNNNNFSKLEKLSVIKIIIIDKLGYSYKSNNININIESFDKLSVDFSKISNIDFFFLLIKDNNITVINPFKKNNIYLHKNDLLIIYSKSDSNTINISEFNNDIFDYINKGKSVRKYFDKTIGNKSNKIKQKNIVNVTDKPDTYVKSKEVSSKNNIKSSNGKLKTSPPYGIQVTNELFHNGNVEAWKKIIESYLDKYKNNDILVYYDNEKITNLEALFKWGKVKTGTLIFIRIIGEKFNDIAKLKKYLYLGASPHFEQFLKGPVNKKLKLF